MGNIREILVRWVSPGTAGGVTVLHTADLDPVADQRAAIKTFLTGFMQTATAGTVYVVATSGKVLDDTTGNLVDTWSDNTTQSAAGSGSGQPVPNASQALIRLRTLTIVRNRMLQGRIYLPGLVAGATAGGEITGAAAAVIVDYANAAVATDIGLVIWSRPLKDDDGNVLAPGTSAVVTGVTLWNELAVQRKRRS